LKAISANEEKDDKILWEGMNFMWIKLLFTVFPKPMSFGNRDIKSILNIFHLPFCSLLAVLKNLSMFHGIGNFSSAVKV